jgi:hypothetical protein
MNCKSSNWYHILLVILSFLSVFSLSTWEAKAQEASRTEEGAQSLQTWEDVLLLEAIRYLKLTPDQLQKMTSVAEMTHAALVKSQEEKNRNLLALERIAKKQREILLSGNAPSTQEQREATELNKALQGRKAKIDEEISSIAVPRFFFFLKSQQLQSIVWLVHGETPPTQARNDVLLDPSAGFVQQTVNEVLQSRVAESEMLYARALQEQLPPDATDKDREGFAAMQADQRANLLRARTAMTEFRGNVQKVTQRLLHDSSDKEMREAVQFLTKRMFTSPRLYPVLQARLKQGKAQ